MNNNIEWKYKIDVKDLAVFDEIAKERGIKFPTELKDFVIKANAATPSKYKFMAGNTEKVFGAVLSFNRGESDTDSAFSALASINDKRLLPFGIDPFGNYICYALDNQSIVFWDHEYEDGNVTEICESLEQFLESLY